MAAELGLPGLLGWSWADPIAAIVIAVIAVKEGINAWKGDSCCPTPTFQNRGDGSEPGCCDDDSRSNRRNAR